jgi:flotillin
MFDFVDFAGGGPLLVVVAVVIIALLASYVASRYRVANANEALIVAGSRGARVRDERGEVAAPKPDDKGIRVVVGGGTFVLPLIHKVGKLKLTARQIGVALPDAVTSQGIKVAVQGVATFKIGRDVESIRNAAERFLDSKEEQVDSIVKNVLEGSLRSIVGTLTIEELIMDRQKLLQQVQDSAKGDLATSGLQIDAFTIQSIADESGYIELLGQQKLAVVERDARMAKATSDQEAAVREAEAQQVKINAQRDVALREAEVQTQTSAAQARAAQAGPLAQAEAQQEVTRRQTELAELAAARTEKELLATTVRPAEADAEAVVKRADGERQAQIAAAQAAAERARLAGEAEARVAFAKGEAQARVVSLNADAEAHRVQVEGNAEAEVTLTKGEAEAKALALRAEAYKQFNEAAVIQTVLGQLPAIVRAAAEPMGKIGSLTVLSSDGASDVVRTATRTVAEGAAAVKGLTGMDVPDLISEAMGRHGDGDRGRPAGPSAPAPAVEGPTAPPDRRQARRRSRDQSSGTSAAAGQAPATRAAGDATPAEPDAAASFARAVDTIQRAGATGPEPGSVPPSAAPLGGGTSEPTLEIPEGMPTEQAAESLAAALGAVPGIQRYAGTTLNELAQRGPRVARGLWAMARMRLGDEYGEMTIGQLLSRYTGR